MPIHAGIDEAGYGPFTGPLTVGCAVLRVPSWELDPWLVLAPALARTPAAARKQGLLAVGDSKKLGGHGDTKHLEAAVMAFLACVPSDAGGRGLPVNVTQVLGALGVAGESWPTQPWYQARGPETLPAQADVDLLRIQAAGLKRVLAAADMSCLALRVRAVDEARFNAEAALTHNKATISFRRVGLYLAALWARHGEEGLRVTVDRQGGRARYLELLRTVFPHAQLQVLAEADGVSRYAIAAGSRHAQVEFREKAEQHSLPTALAAMAAKWVRELLMERFNGYFCAMVPTLAPTAGYGLDGRRWLREIAVHLPPNITAADLTRVL